MNSKSARRLLSWVVILCFGCGMGMGCTPSPKAPGPPPFAAANTCAEYGGFTVALAEATVNCTGTIGLESFTLERSVLRQKFSQCTVGDPQQREATYKVVTNLLALQEALDAKTQKKAYPGLQECLGERYSRWSELFQRTKLKTCPMWSEPVVLTNVSSATTRQLSKTQPQFDYFAPGRVPKRLKPSPEQRFLALQVPAKRTVLYKIHYPAKVEANAEAKVEANAEAKVEANAEAKARLEGCEDPAVCAAQCASFLPGFVIAAAGDRLVADPANWYENRSTNPCGDMSDPDKIDPWCPPYTHGMSITLTTPDSTVPPGDLYGDPARGNKGERCLRWRPDPDGGPGANYKTDLNVQCTGFCLSRCGE